MTDQTATQAASLRQWLADAIRAAACPGGCDQTEEECARQRIQPVVWHHGVLAEVEGTPEQFADVMLGVLSGPIPLERKPVPGVREVRITVRAPSDENAGQWAETIRDLIVGEYGDSMRLEVTILPGGGA